MSSTTVSFDAPKPANEPVKSPGREGERTATSATVPTDVSKLILTGCLALVLLVIGPVGWALVAPLNHGVVAPATLVVESNRRDIQHMEGGIVRTVHVRDGSEVKAGDPLISLDPVRALASLQIARGQMDAIRASIARFRAEQAGNEEIAFDADLLETAKTDASVADVIRGQEAIFRARRALQRAQIEVLQQRISQLQAQIIGMESQDRSRKQQLDFIQEELNGVNELMRGGHAPRTRALSLLREVARLEGEQGEYLSAIARTRQQIGETEVQILQVELQVRDELSKNMQDALNQQREIQERLVASEDIVRHLVIRAPVDGVVVGLTVPSVGGVVVGGRTIMQIVPESDRLLIEAQVQPQDVELLHEGLEVIIRFPALPQRSLPSLKGRLLLVGADRQTDERSGMPYFKIRVAPDPESLAAIADRRLVAGMPAEVTIATGQRTAARYLVEPLMDAVRGAMRER